MRPFPFLGLDDHPKALGAIVPDRPDLVAPFTRAVVALAYKELTVSTGSR